MKNSILEILFALLIFIVSKTYCNDTFNSGWIVGILVMSAIYGNREAK